MSHIQDATTSQPPMLCLLDSGATSCWISRKKPPPTLRTDKIPAITNQTLAGSFTSNESVTLRNILLPEFHRTRRLDSLPSRKIFDQLCRYDMILGRDFMNKLGILLNFNSKSMEWDKAIVAMGEHPTSTSTTSLATNLLLEAIDDRLENNDSNLMLEQTSNLYYQAKNTNPDGYKSTTITTSLFEPANLQDIVAKCVYLLPQQRQQLYNMLQKFHKLFDGQLKTFKGPLVGAHGHGPPSSLGADTGLPSTDVMDPVIPPSACGGDVHPDVCETTAIPRGTEPSVTSVEVV